MEILSPFNRRHDLVIKREIYKRAGIASYWIVDPDEPSITGMELVDDDYVEFGKAVGDVALSVAKPYKVTVRPADLVR